MGTRKSARSMPGGARSAGGHPSAQPTRQSRPVRVRTRGPIRLPDGRLRQLSLLALRLRVIYGIAVSAELALRQQGAERDPEIADCLRGGVCDPIAEEIRDLEVTVHLYRSKASEPNP